MSDREALLAAKIAIIRQEFLTRLQSEWIPNLRVLRQRFLAAPSDAALLQELLHAAHDMTGSGAVFGCSEISTWGRQLEERLRPLIKREATGSETDQNEILDLIDRLEAVCTAAVRDKKEMTSGGSKA